MDRDAFDSLMSSLDPPMVVVTAAAGGERAGCLVGFHAQSSIGPARYCLWLSQANRTHAVALRATHLGVHLLSQGDHRLAERFGAVSGDDVDKFAGLDVVDGPHGVPWLAAVPHRLAVRPVALIDDDGDHTGVVAEPVAAETAGRFRPLRLSDVDDVTAGHDADDPPHR
jgi:flavin reductase (DIM6/NTAB) family NADH-FMN oxidoreductase RutF